ncbi:MAG: hypothetical protein K1000chlam4_00496 [Chlamydiae bacterium]|nr:hypothetical protein [Chlamydiota bacterium]
MTAPTGLKKLQYCPFVSRGDKADLQEGKKILKYDQYYQWAKITVLAIAIIATTAYLNTIAIPAFGSIWGHYCIVEKIVVGSIISSFGLGVILFSALVLNRSKEQWMLKSDLQNLHSTEPRIGRATAYFDAEPICTPFELHRYGLLSKRGALLLENALNQYFKNLEAFASYCFRFPPDISEAEIPDASIRLCIYQQIQDDHDTRSYIYQQIRDDQEWVRGVIYTLRFQDNSSDIAPLPKS